MDAQALYYLALTRVPQIGTIAARQLLQHFSEPENIFSAKLSTLSAVDGIGRVRAKNIKAFKEFDPCAAEIDFAEKFGYQIVGLNHTAYPRRLLNCADAPTVLFVKGTANLNVGRTAAIIGTRTNTDYGKQLVAQLVQALTSQQVQIISGMAFGIDTLAHRETIKQSGVTVGVMAHGFGSMYPPENKKLAAQMLEAQGALVTEYTYHTQAEKHNFPVRNRIVAGMADATIVVETGVKGGSMITAKLANEYNRDVFAFPGRTSDTKSAGCNHLIRTNMGGLITEASQLMEMMNWMEQKHRASTQRLLFTDLSSDEKIVVDLLKHSDLLPIDELTFSSGLPASQLAATLLGLELRGIIATKPGRLYTLL